MTVKIKCEPYLIQFLEAIYGTMPIILPKNNDLAYALDHLLDRPPKEFTDETDGEGVLVIQLPFFEDKNVMYNFYLSDLSKRLFVKRVDRFFKLKFREEINKSRLAGITRKDAIGLFIEKFDLNPDITDMLEKDYHRYINLRNWHRKKKARKTLKKSSSD